MNVTELARILKITPQEVRDYMPQFGFDVGQKAIKINRNVANKIIKEWPTLRKKIERKKMEEAGKITEKINNTDQTAAKKTIEIPSFITVRDFSAISGLPINAILAELMKNGVFASLNEKIDYDTAWLVGSELGLEIKQKNEEHEKADEKNKLKEILAQENKDKLLQRPPVIVVMGHVDHGKTLLLDSVRRTHVADGEAGGITQHIGAYQVKQKDQLITFIDTPGHEAFTAMRSRGAKIADIAILVVAADDGVKPQTVEAYKIIQAAKIPFVVAINKIDKPEANIDKTKQELSSKLNIIPEDWGGKTICVPVSALKGTGISDLLDMVLLLADSEADNIKANPDASAAGSIIESHIDKGSGAVATILIQNGTMAIGDPLSLNGVHIGKVRVLNNYLGEKIEKAGPATPVQIIGLKLMPQVGDLIKVEQGEKTKFRKNKTVKQFSEAKISSTEDNENIKKINIVIKSDVLGSAEAIEESIEKINTKEVKVKIIHKGLGNITDGDIKRAEASDGFIVGFNVKVPPAIEELAREKNIEIKIYRIIYDLIDDVKEKMEKIVEPVIERVELGDIKVLAVFKTNKDGQIIGGKVISGKAENGSMIEIMRNNEFIENGKLVKLQAGKQDVQIVEAGEECGIQFEGRPLIERDDILHLYKEEKKNFKL